MTVSADPLALSPAAVPGVWRVYRSSVLDAGPGSHRKLKRDLTKPEWEEDPRYRVESITLTSGATPSTCLLSLPANESGVVVTSFGLTWGRDVDNTGDTTATVLRPDGLYLWDDVKVHLGDGGDESRDTEPVVFRGYVVRVWEDLAVGQVYILCADARAIMGGMPIHGAAVWNDFDKAYQWTSAHQPVFNRGGKADMADDSEVEGQVAETQPAFTHVGGVSPLAWTRGHVWNYLRYYWQVQAPDSVRQSLAGWVDVPELSNSGAGAAMFAQYGYENAWPALALGGKKLNAALALLARARHDYDVTMTYDVDRSYVKLYGTGGASITEEQGRVSLRRGEIGDKVTDADGLPEIVAGRLGYDVRGAYTAVRIHGAAKVLDLSFDTVAGTLAEGWLPADLGAASPASGYLGLSEADKAKGKQFSSVFRRYVIPDDLDWPAEYRTAIPLLRARSLGATLVSVDEATAEASGRGVRIRAQAWYSTDGGSNWILAPHALKCQPDALAVELDNAARYGVHRWTNDGAGAAYDVRITVRVEIDERVEATESFEPWGWPVLEHLLVDDHYKYTARRKAHLRATGGVPKLDGGTAAEFGASSDDVIRNDTDQASAAAYALRSQLLRAPLTGDPEVDGIRLDLVPGTVVEKLLAGGAAGSGAARPDWPINAVVRRTTFEVRANRTVVSFRAD